MCVFGYCVVHKIEKLGDHKCNWRQSESFIIEKGNHFRNWGSFSIWKGWLFSENFKFTSEIPNPYGITVPLNGKSSPTQKLQGAPMWSFQKSKNLWPVLTSVLCLGCSLWRKLIKLSACVFTTPVLPSVEKKDSKTCRVALAVHTCYDPYFGEQNVNFSYSVVPYEKSGSSVESKAQANKSRCPKGCNLRLLCSGSWGTFQRNMLLSFFRP